MNAISMLLKYDELQRILYYFEKIYETKYTKLTDDFVSNLKFESYDATIIDECFNVSVIFSFEETIYTAKFSYKLGSDGIFDMQNSNITGWTLE